MVGENSCCNASYWPGGEGAVREENAAASRGGTEMRRRPLGIDR